MFNYISHLASCSSVSIVNFEYAIAGWVVTYQEGKMADLPL